MVTLTISGGTVEERAMIRAFVGYDLSIRGVELATRPFEEVEADTSHHLVAQWYENLEAENGFAEVGLYGIKPVTVKLVSRIEASEK